MGVLLQVEGIDVNAHSSNSGQTALMISAGKGYLGMCEKLLSKGKAVVDYRSFDGWSASFFCVFHNHEKILKLLLARNVDVNLADAQGQTPLIVASYAGHVTIVDILLENGALVNVKTLSGYTSLMRAAEKNHVEIMQKLISAGADVDAETRNKKTALQFAISNNHKEAINVLILSGAQPTPSMEFPDLAEKDHRNEVATSAVIDGTNQMPSPSGLNDNKDRMLTQDKENELGISAVDLKTSPPNGDNDDMEKIRSSSLDGSHGKSMDGQSLFA